MSEQARGGDAQLIAQATEWAKKEWAGHSIVRPLLARVQELERQLAEARKSYDTMSEACKFNVEKRGELEREVIRLRLVEEAHKSLYATNRIEELERELAELKTRVQHKPTCYICG